MDLNKTADLVLDTRTPPKVKQQQKQKETIENSHAGIAEPIDEDSIILEESTKRTNFYKLEKPTTTSGLSTWILLSGQTSPPPPKTTKRIENNLNLTVVTETPNRIMKPIFKKRVTTTTRKPQTTTTSENITIISTPAPANITKLNKIKASVLNSAKKSTTTTTTTETSPTTILVKIETTNVPKKNVTFNETADMNAIDSNSLPLEPKDGDTELSTSSATTTAKPKKTRRPTTKRKKNSNRKRRPSNKNSNSTDVSKPSNKDTLGFAPMYNYLKKQVMPAVEAGLVGLMVTAGLGIAGYFLYPFGAARRTYDIDRKDKGSYYYTDDYYSGGIAEEEAIGKVIAGMQVDNYADNAYRKHPKNSYPNIQYKPSNMERVSPSRNYNTEKDIIEQNKETSFSVDDKQFVVGNMPKDIYPEVTPVTVPEHGPRRRRQVDEMENEIFPDDANNANQTETTTITTNITATETSNSTTTQRPSHEVAPHKSFLHLLNDLFRMKISLGLQLLHNATESVARYLTRVQKRVDEHYKEHNRTFSCL